MSEIVVNNDKLKKITLKGSRVLDDDLCKLIPALKRSTSIESVELDMDVDENVRKEIEDAIRGGKGNLSK